MFHTDKFILIEKRIIPSTGATLINHTNECAAFIVNEVCDKRDRDAIRARDDIHWTAETCRAYDALQHPLMLFLGENGYHLTLKLRILMLQENK